MWHKLVPLHNRVILRMIRWEQTWSLRNIVATNSKWFMPFKRGIVSVLVRRVSVSQHHFVFLSASVRVTSQHFTAFWTQCFNWFSLLDEIYTFYKYSNHYTGCFFDGHGDSPKALFFCGWARRHITNLTETLSTTNCSGLLEKLPNAIQKMKVSWSLQTHVGTHVKARCELADVKLHTDPITRGGCRSKCERPHSEHTAVLSSAYGVASLLFHKNISHWLVI